jgi:hypothetical protein
MAKVNIICIGIPPISSHIAVGMHLLQDSLYNRINAPNWGQPIGEDRNESNVDPIQVTK